MSKMKGCIESAIEILAASPSCGDAISQLMQEEHISESAAEYLINEAQNFRPIYYVEDLCEDYYCDEERS